MSRVWPYSIVGTLLWCAAIVGAQQSTTTIPAANDGLDAIVTRLASNDFVEREAAQKELARLTWRDRDKLLKLAERTTDVEAKARILGRVEELEIQLASDPPAISLDLKNATLSDVCTALEKELGVKFDSQMRGRPFGGLTYTLSLKDKPFWEVFQELSAQHPIMLQGYNGLQFFQQDPGLSRGAISGGFAIFPMSINRSRTANLQRPAGNELQPEQMNLQMMIAVDPRMRILKRDQPQLYKAIDDAGNQLVKDNRPPAGERTLNIWDSGNAVSWQFSSPLLIPEKPGKKIVSAQGEMHVLLQVASMKVEVTDVDKKLRQKIQVGSHTLIINQFELKENIINFQVARQQNPAEQGFNPGESIGVQMTFIDSTGRRVWSTTVQGGSGGSAGGGQITGPLKVEFSVPIKTKELTVPFEFRDIPLP